MYVSTTKESQKIIIPDRLRDNMNRPSGQRTMHRNVTVNPANNTGIAFAYGFTLYVEDAPGECTWQVYAYRRQIMGSKMIMVPVHER